MSRWITDPANCLRGLAHNVCWAKGMAAVCREVLCIARDDDTSVPERLQEIVRYYREGVDYKPAKPFPEHPPYHPKVTLPRVPKEYELMMGLLDEEPMHGYILGKRAASSLICGMALDTGERDAKGVLDGIIALCFAVIEITGGERP